jgi:hypothetical protein
MQEFCRNKGHWFSGDWKWRITAAVIGSPCGTCRQNHNRVRKKISHLCRRHKVLVENTGCNSSRRPLRDGMWVWKRKSHPVAGNTFRPWRDGWMNCAGYFSTPILCLTAQRPYINILAVSSCLCGYKKCSGTVFLCDAGVLSQQRALIFRGLRMENYRSRHW